MGKEQNNYRDVVKRVLALAGTGGSDNGGKEHKVNDILRFSGTDQQALRGRMQQLAMKIAGEPK
jgi:hypothetical protein